MSFMVPARPQVDKILDELGLTKCANTRIGHSGAGISGGERKRLSFATEMLIDPSVLIVDEPTSGLDSAMAESVVEKLKTLATGSGSKKRTVVMTIHQPSAELFKLIDKLLIIVDGKVGYFGPAKAAVGYFSDTLGDLGTCPENSNPPDFFMRLVSTIAAMLSVSCSHFFLITFARFLRTCPPIDKINESPLNRQWPVLSADCDRAPGPHGEGKSN
jgi:ABC-type multidrug transport system ATPase subunit